MKAGVYGLGRFGTFWAKSLRDVGCEVIAYSRSAHELPEGIKRVSEEEVLNAPYLFFTVAISSFEDVLKRVSSKIGKDTVVLDTCSVKVYPSLWMNKYLKHETIKIATHPMFGPDSGANGLKGLPIVICPPQERDYHYDDIKKLFSSMGLKVLEMSADEHDREAAYSQGVTHFVGRVLSEMGMKPTEIATKGYRSLMTIVEQTCNDPLQLFYDLQRFNPYTKEMRAELVDAIGVVLNKLETEDKA